MRQLVFALALALVGAAAVPALAERPAPAQPDGGHGFGRLPWQSWIDPAVPPRRPTPQRFMRIVYAFDAPAKSQMTADIPLSKLCRSGLFMQIINYHYRAFGPKEEALGVAFGRMSVNLYDPTRQRQEDTVYFFRDQGTPRCAVFTAKQADLNRFYIGP